MWQLHTYMYIHDMTRFWNHSQQSLRVCKRALMSTHMASTQYTRKVLVCYSPHDDLHEQHMCIFVLHKLNSCICVNEFTCFPHNLCFIGMRFGFTQNVICSKLNTCVCEYLLLNTGSIVYFFVGIEVLIMVLTFSKILWWCSNTIHT